MNQVFLLIFDGSTDDLVNNLVLEIRRDGGTTRCQPGICFSSDAGFSANTACNCNEQTDTALAGLRRNLFHFLRTN